MFPLVFLEDHGKTMGKPVGNGNLPSGKVTVYYGRFTLNGEKGGSVTNWRTGKWSEKIVGKSVW